MTDDSADDMHRLAQLIKDVRVAMFTTILDDAPRSRPMFTQDHPFDGTLWFMTSVDSGITQDIARKPSVLLTYAHPGKETYITINGTATVSNDRAMIHELWNAAAKVWFPAGEDDPAIRLIQVAVERAEFWDAPAAPVRAVQFAKAYLTGQQMEGGTHETLHLSGAEQTRYRG